MVVRLTFCFSRVAGSLPMRGAGSARSRANASVKPRLPGFRSVDMVWLRRWRSGVSDRFGHLHCSDDERSTSALVHFTHCSGLQEMPVRQLRPGRVLFQHISNVHPAADQRPGRATRRTSMVVRPRFRHGTLTAWPNFSARRRPGTLVIGSLIAGPTPAAQAWSVRQASGRSTISCHRGSPAERRILADHSALDRGGGVEHLLRHVSA